MFGTMTSLQISYEKHDETSKRSLASIVIKYSTKQGDLRAMAGTTTSCSSSGSTKSAKPCCGQSWSAKPCCGQSWSAIAFALPNRFRA